MCIYRSNLPQLGVGCNESNDVLFKKHAANIIICRIQGLTPADLGSLGAITVQYVCYSSWGCNTLPRSSCKRVNKFILRWAEAVEPCSGNRTRACAVRQAANQSMPKCTYLRRTTIYLHHTLDPT
jgi:hypothetical protein